LVCAVLSLRANQANFFTSAVFDTVDANYLAFGVRDLFLVTVLISMCALVLAVSIAVGIAAFLTQYAPARLARPFAAIADLLAAVTSIIFGLWGIFVLAPRLEPVAVLRRACGGPSTDRTTQLHCITTYLNAKSRSSWPAGQSTGTTTANSAAVRRTGSTSLSDRRAPTEEARQRPPPPFSRLQLGRVPDTCQTG
jgi:hypothetical protein